MTYSDAYHAQTAIESALSWLHDEDGWTWSALRERVDDLISDAEEEEPDE